MGLVNMIPGVRTVKTVLFASAITVVVSAAVGVFMYVKGGNDVRDEIKAKAALEALERYQAMENNDATFKSLTDYDRCLKFMRTSGLPVDECDKRFGVSNN